jgi:protocatechuate 3,4-dioxygenase beta subunit
MRREPRPLTDTDHPPHDGRRRLLVTLGGAALWAACGDGQRTETTAGGGDGASGSGGSGEGATSGGGGGGGESSATTASGQGGDGPTPSCEETAEDIEGPYYKPDAPLLAPDAKGRSILSPEQPGERIVLEGRVLGLDCAPLADGELDLWHADAAGTYDLKGFVLRGRVRTASDGRFAIDTVLPGRYLNGATYRPRHLHLKVRAAGHAELTTQLYFPGDPYNDSDPFFDDRLLVAEEVAGGERYARFEFVLALEGGV